MRRGPFRQAVDGVSQIREHVWRFFCFRRLTIERHFSPLPELESQSANQKGQLRMSSRNSAEEPCHGWRASVSAKWHGRSRVIFACPLEVGESHPGNVKEVQHLLAGGRSTRPSSHSAGPRAHQSRDGAVHDFCSRSGTAHGQETKGKSGGRALESCGVYRPAGLTPH